MVICCLKKVCYFITPADTYIRDLIDIQTYPFSVIDADLEFDYLHNFGPRFKKLADMYGEQPDSSEDDEDAIGNEDEMDGVPSDHHHHHQYPHQHHQHRANSHLSDRYDDHQQV